MVVKKTKEFGDGNSAERFFDIMTGGNVWKTPTQKQFVDLN